MPDTFSLIQSVTVGSGGQSSIDFTAIPASYANLCIKASVRGSTNIGTTSMRLRYNSTTTNLTNRRIDGGGTTGVDSSSGTDGAIAILQGADATANAFGNYEIYIPSYAGSANKSASSDTVNETFGGVEYVTLYAHLWSQTSPITSIQLTPSSGTFVQNSTAYLYGIVNS